MIVKTDVPDVVVYVVRLVDAGGLFEKTVVSEVVIVEPFESVVV